jgi:hypothetical protein
VDFTGNYTYKLKLGEHILWEGNGTVDFANATSDFATILQDYIDTLETGGVSQPLGHGILQPFEIPLTIISEYAGRSY